MKKLFLMAVAAVAMLATSCSKDDTNAVAGGEKSTVTFSVEAPVMVTRADLGDGTTATDLSWAVYAEDGTYLPNLGGSQENAFDAELKANVKIDLVNGKKYSVIFWAGAKEAPYTVDFATKTMTVNDPLAANQEKYDAFYKYQEVATVNGARTETIELTRPFAQLNIATADTQKAAYGGLVVKQTKVVVPVYGTLNLKDGSVADRYTRTFAMADILSGETISVGGKSYDLLSMNYLLVNTKAIQDVVFTVKNGTFEQEYTYHNVPLQRNYKTNIIGNILTSTLDFEITIDPIFEKPDYESTGFVGAKVGGKVYQTLAEAIANAYDGDVIELSKDEFEFPTQISTKGTRAAERFLTFAGQGDETVISFSSKAGGADGGLNCYADGLSLKFRDLKVVSPNTGSAYSGGFGRAKSIEFNNCTYVGQYRSHGYTKWEDCTIDPQTSYIYTDAFNVDFINCKFNSSEGKGIQVYGDPNNFSSTINVIGCEFVAAKQGLTYSGRPVSAIDINSQGEKFTVNIENTTAKGYGPGDYSGNGLWNIKGGVEHITVMVDGELAAISVGTNEKLDSALKENKEYINVELTGNVSLNTQDAYLKLGGEDTKVITIDGNNKTLTLSTTYWSRFSTVNPDAKVVLKNMNLTSSQETGTWNSYDITINCNVELENVKLLKALAFDGANTVASLKNVTITESHDYYALWISAAGQKVTIDGLTINSAGRGIKIDEQYVDAVAKVTLNINNAKFVTKKKAAILVKSVAGAEINVSNIDITEVNDDSEFAVWVDVDSKAYADLVVVKGAKVIVEGATVIDDEVTTEDVNDVLANGGDIFFDDDFNAVDCSTNGYGSTGLSQMNGGIIDGNGNTLSVSGATGTWDSAISTNGGTIKNLTIDSGFRGVFVKGGDNASKVYLDKVIIDGTTYTISCDSASNQGLEAKDSVFKGWTSYAGTLGEASFTNCKFGRGNGYAFCRPYAPTKFVGCDFEAGFTVDPRANVEFENCTYGDVALTADNIADLVTNTANVTVK